MTGALDGPERASERARLTRRVATRIAACDGDRAPTPAELDRLALEVFAFQYRAIPAYGGWCAARGIAAADVASPWEIPPVPSEAFKHLALFAGEPTEIVRTFRTSGTSLAEARGVAPFSAEGLALMDVAIDVQARRMLFPDVERTRIVALAPAPDTDPERIMAYGLGRLIVRFGAEGSAFFVGSTGVDVTGVITALDESARAGRSITIAGASSALAAVTAALDRADRSIALPSGSRVMHAGGTKRGSEPVDPAALCSATEARLGVPSGRCVNLLGMTELASQLYDDRLRALVAGEPRRSGKVAPPWGRTWAVSPDHGEALPPGQIGLLRHLDLANVERPVCVQTDDLGLTYPDGSFEILGRAAGADARGCALDVDEWHGVSRT